jgi:hypothetical protein
MLRRFIHFAAPSHLSCFRQLLFVAIVVTLAAFVAGAW